MLHPKEILSSQAIETLRGSAFATEELKSLPDEILQLIYNERWFQVLVPKVCGGLEYTLPQAVQLFEALAYAEANVGWCVNLGAGANMFSGYLNEDVSKSIFNNVKTCCAGSGAVSGKAKKSNGGYILNGRWKYASGANHATHFTANAYLLNEDGTQIYDNDQPVFRSFIIPANKIINFKNWDAIGLKATSSNDFEAVDVFVQEEHTFTLLKPSAFANGTVYQFPFMLLAQINMTCMITGIALHFLESYEQLAVIKKPLHADVTLAENPKAKSVYENVSKHFHEARMEMYKTLDLVWKRYENAETVDEKDIQRFDTANKEATVASRNVINELFPLCGLNIVSPQSEMNKIWRDLAVAGQHYLLSPLH